MAGDTKDLKVNLTAHDRGVAKTFATVSESAGRLHGRLGFLSEGLKHATELMGGFAAIEIFKKGMEEASAFQQVMLQTNAILKSTGDVSGASAKDIKENAHALQEVSGVQEVLIQHGENVLLAFTNIRNAAGKHNDIFNQATKATLNLSVALGKDMQSSAVLVGKALQDPIHGLGALSKAGVQFTVAQKDVIKHLVMTGHGLDAQKMILKQVEVRFGGAAKAAGSGFGGSIAKLRNTVMDMVRDLIMNLLPTLTKVAQWLAVHIPKAIAAVKAEFVKLHPQIQFVVGMFHTLVTFVQQNHTWLLKLAGSIGAAVAVIKVWTVVTRLLNLAMKANPILLVISLVAMLVTAFVTAYKTSQTFRDRVTLAFYDVEHVVGLVVKSIIEYMQGVLHALLTMVGGILHAMAAAFGWADNSLNVARDNFDRFEGTVLNGMQDFANKAGQLGVEAGARYREGIAAGLAQQQANAAALAAANAYSPISGGVARGSHGPHGGILSLAKRVRHARQYQAQLNAGPALDFSMPKSGGGGGGAGGGGGGHKGVKAGTAAHKAATAAARAHAAALRAAAKEAAHDAAEFKKAAAAKIHAAKLVAAALAKEAAAGLAEMKKQAAAYKAEVDAFRTAMKDAIQGGAIDLAALSQNADGVTSLASLQTNLAARLASVKKFAADLKALAAAGASKDLIAQVAGMGPGAGDQLASDLINGGADAIKGVSDQMKQISDAAQGGADALTKQFYQPGADAISQLIAGMQSRYPMLRKALEAIAAEVSATLNGTTTAVAAGKPTMAGGSYGGAGAGQMHQPIVLQLNGQTVGTVMGPILRSGAIKSVQTVGTYTGTGTTYKPGG